MGLTIEGNKRLPYQLLSSEIISKIASGADHIVLLTNHGEIYTCGCGEQGQLGRISERSSGRNARSGIGNNIFIKVNYIQKYYIFSKITRTSSYNNKSQFKTTF